MSARIIHECAHELTVPMTKLCRLSIERGVCPKAWKRANIVPIHKKRRQVQRDELQKCQSFAAI